MKTNSSWIETDYHMQTFWGSIAGILLFASLFALLFSKEAALIFTCLAMIFIIPIATWQVLSGLVYAFRGDRLQQIYLMVVAIFFSIWYLATRFDADFAIILMVIAIIIGIWKYTVVRADYISLAIIDVPKESENDVLDA